MSEDVHARRGRRPLCPTCRRRPAETGPPVRPFCSVACQLVDLGRWLDGAYRVPGAEFDREPADDRDRAAADR